MQSALEKCLEDNAAEVKQAKADKPKLIARFKELQDMLRAFVAFDPEKLPVMIFAQGEKDEPVLLKTIITFLVLVYSRTLPAIILT